MSVDPTVKLVNGCFYVNIQCEADFILEANGKDKRDEKGPWTVLVKADGTQVVVIQKKRFPSFYQNKFLTNTWHFGISKVDEFVLNKTEKKEVNTPGLGLYLGFVSVVVLTWFMNKN